MTNKPRSKSQATLAVFLALVAQSAWTAESTPATQSLEQAASDPTASLMSVQAQDLYSGDYYLNDGATGNVVLLRSAVPFDMGGLQNIARATLPIVTDSVSGKSGLGDLVLFDLVKFEKSWGRWGVGPVLLVPTATEDELGTKKWAIGPAVGIVVRSDRLMWGMFNQNLFSFAGDDDRDRVAITSIQPIVNYSLPHKWSLGSSEMNVTYDWVKSGWTNLPLGVKAAKLIKVGKLPVQFSGAYEYNFANDFVAPKWTLNFSIKCLFPI